MRRNKFLVLLAGTLLLCALTFTGFSAPSASAASAKTATHTTVAVPAAVNCPTVGYGYVSTGPAVLHAQQSLNWWYHNNTGFRTWINKWYPGDLPILEDSSYGGETWGATWDFQYWYGLTHDGIIGRATWSALRSDCVF